MLAWHGVIHNYHRHRRLRQSTFAFAALINPGICTYVLVVVDNNTIIKWSVSPANNTTPIRNNNGSIHERE